MSSSVFYPPVFGFLNLPTYGALVALSDILELLFEIAFRGA